MPQESAELSETVETFIQRWDKAEAAERANYQLFLAELTDLLGVPHPDPSGADNEFNCVLENSRKAEPLNVKGKKIHNDGLVSLLKQIHDDLDTAALEAYGWQDLVTTTPLSDRLAQSDEAILTTLKNLGQR